MKKSCLLAFAIAGVLVGCSEDKLVSENVSNLAREIPIEFSVQKENVTRAANLETVKHYNFGVWAWKVNGGSLNDMEVMNHYLVGWSNGTNLGYDYNGATTWKETAGETSDHFSPWFYEKLGTSEYTNPNYGYSKDSTDYMSNNTNQYLRYWDLAYGYTNFYCYAPYVHTDKEQGKEVSFSHNSEGTSKMTFAEKTIRDGYDEPLNGDYKGYNRSLSEFMYAGVHAQNSQLSDVIVPFKHMGAQVFIRFYEDIPGYKVEIINLSDDNGKMKDGIANTDDKAKGIQMTPSVAPESGKTHTLGAYYTTQGAEILFPENGDAATYTAKWDGSETTSDPLMFMIPQEGKATASFGAPANLTNFDGLDSKTHKVIKEEGSDGKKEYSYSPTIYYAVAQPTGSTTGFNFHISYRIIAEDNKEVITVHDATVFIPAKGKATVGNDENDNAYIAAWQPGQKYTYTFKITKNSTGTTDPSTTIDPTDPTPSDVKALYPIVFDNATIEDYTEVTNETTHNDKDTTY